MLEWNEVQTMLSRHALRREQPATMPHQGLVLGNADMGAVIFGPAHNLRFRLNKLDLWDARMNAQNLRPLLPLSQFKKFIFAESEKLQRGEVVPIQLDGGWEGGDGTLYPCMRTGADFTVRICSVQQSLPMPMV